MVHSCRSTLSTIASGKEKIYVTGHSLGGSFSLFMAATLYYDHDVVPQGVYAFAGTFIGDEEYTKAIQDPLTSTFPIQFMEVVDRHDPDRRDSTSEEYQTADQSLDIVRSMICGLYLDPLGPLESYGLHDLKNYQKAIFENSTTSGSKRCWKDAPLVVETRWC
jgi:dienelactone hydrolase